jgi:hypothetical protein
MRVDRHAAEAYKDGVSEGDLIRKDELSSAVAARRELGPEYEDEVVDALVEKIERRLEKRLEERRPAPVQRGEPPWRQAPLIASLGLSIPLLGIAGGTGGVPGIALVALAIVLVNYFYYRR